MVAETAADSAEQEVAAPTGPVSGDVVRLTSAEGTVFSVRKGAALTSDTIRLMLEGLCVVEGAPANEICFRELETDGLAEAVRYMNYKYDKHQGLPQPPFVVDGASAIRQFRVANYLAL